MPFINLKTTEKITDSIKEELTALLGKAITIIPGKSERWLMLNFEGERQMAFAGDAASPAAFLEVKIFGKARGEDYEKLTAILCDTVKEKLSVPKDRIYIKYEEVSDWGWNGANF